MITARDQMNVEVNIDSSQRIISLVPSQTELLFDLGLDHRIVGVTKFCIHPLAAKQKTMVGGTKQFHFDVIESLKPDLIIGNKEENYEEGILRLREKYPVWMSDIFHLKDALKMIDEVSKITQTEQEGKRIIETINLEWKSIQSFVPLKTLYLIWRKPWMVAGTNTFIHSVLKDLRLINSIEGSRYPELTDKQLIELNPQLILLSSEPFPFREKHIDELQALLPKARIVLVDGEMFSWYGSRLMKAPAYFNTLRNQLS